MADFEKKDTREYLKYIFSIEEKRGLADNLALAVMKKDESNAALKSAQTQIKSEIAKHEADVTSLAEKIRSGFEMRYVECEETKDFLSGTFTVTRKDTGEIVTERPLTSEERQTSLPMTK